MSKRTDEVLRILDESGDWASGSVAEYKHSLAQILALVALTEELEKANELKMREIKEIKSIREKMRI